MKPIKPNDPRLQLQPLDRVLHWGYPHRKDDGPVIAWVTNPRLEKYTYATYKIYNDNHFIRLSHNIEDAESGRGSYEPVARVRVYSDETWAVIETWRERVPNLPAILKPSKTGKSQRATSNECYSRRPYEPHRPVRRRPVSGCAGHAANVAGNGMIMDFVTGVVIVWTLCVGVWAMAEAVERLPRG